MRQPVFEQSAGHRLHAVDNKFGARNAANRAVEPVDIADYQANKLTTLPGDIPVKDNTYAGRVGA